MLALCWNGLSTPDEGTANVAKAADRSVSVEAARRLAKRMLRKSPERWAHTRGVAERAKEIEGAVDRADRRLLIAAAWLHEIGYAGPLRRTGFHPLDGGLYLREHKWDKRLVALVAHHSGARFVPVERGFADLMASFDFEETPVSDALTYADQTVGPHGRRMTVEYRINEAITRHGPNSPNARARVERVPYLLAAAARVETRLAARRQ